MVQRRAQRLGFTNDLTLPSLWQSFLLCLRLVGLVIILSSSYEAVRTTLKSIPYDVLRLSPQLIKQLHNFERELFIGWVIIPTAVYGRMAFIRLRVNRKIFNEVVATSYPEESQKLRQSIELIVSSLLKNRDSFYEINDRPYKTVYAITGNWQSGKTTTAGHIIDLLRKERHIQWGGEYYHDTFNFGNINESIHSFFNNIATLTKIDAFRHLALTAAPQSEINLTVGPLNLPNIFTFTQDVWSLRKKIHDKLDDQGKTYIIILDDIDRLLPIEQLQWLRTIELLGKFRGSLLILVPVNQLEVTKALDKSSISKKYLEKILPNTIDIGVDIDFIKREFGIDEDPTPELAGKYAKYLYCLAMRICLSKLTNDAPLTGMAWEHDFAAGFISKIALRFRDGLYIPQGTGSTFNVGPQSEYQIGGNMMLWFNDGFHYSSNEIIRISQYYFHAPSADNYDIDVIKERTVDKFLDIHFLQKVFERVRFKYVERTAAITPNSYAEDPTEEIDFWETIGYSLIKSLENDPAISTYFTYDIISKEIRELLVITDESKEARFFIELTRNGKIAQ